MQLILQRIRRHIWGFLAAILCLTVEAGSDLMQPMLMSGIVDAGVATGNASLIARYGALMLGVALLGAGGAVGRNFLAGAISQRIGKELRHDLYGRIQTFSFENIDALDPASLITRVTNDSTQVQNFINGCMRILVKAPITCIGAIVLILLRTPQELPVIVGILAVAAVLIVFNMRLGYPRFARMQRKLDALNTRSREYLSSVRVVKAFGQEQAERARFGQAAEELADASMSALRVNAAFAPLIQLTVNAGIVLLLALGGYRGGDMPVGRLMASVNYMTQMLMALGMISNILNQLVRATASARRVQEVLDTQPAMQEPGQPQAADWQQGVAFDGVAFGYLGSARQAVSGLSFSVPAGATCGIIGATGCGKSTLVSLIPRFYDAAAGCVTVGGVDVRMQDSHELRRHVAVVPQKALLFSGTVADNLRWGDAAATQAHLTAACRAACADDFVQALPGGYDAVMGQGGVNLSGGQKQRLCIARALLRRPDVLILDDCTSALDATTEAAVLDGLRAFSGGMTVFLISQRIATVRSSDVILVMDRGRIVGQGRHEDLLAACPIYREIYRSQVGGDAHAL